jgi:hypothetical protein
VVAITKKYQNHNNNKKNQYTNINIIIKTSKSLSLKLESVPVGWDGWAGLYEPKERDQREAPRQQQRSQQSRGGDDVSDIPFADPLRSRALCLAC